MMNGERAPEKSALCTHPMLLEGKDALELYLVAIRHNTDLLHEQIALLRAALAERQELLRETDSNSSSEEIVPGPLSGLPKAAAGKS